MGDMGDTFRAMREDSKERKASNYKQSLALLKAHGHQVVQLSDTHFRIGRFDFWPSTGKYLNRETKRYSRGVFNLIACLEKGQR